MTPRRAPVLLFLAFLASCERASDNAPVAALPLFEAASRVDTLPGEYTRVVRAAEFHDSLLVLADVQEQAIWRVHLRSGAREAIGRRGGGPGEYARVGRLAKTHADSIAVFDGFASSPFVVLSVTSGQGRRADVFPASTSTDPAALLLSVSAPYLEAADTLGHVYGAPMMGPTRIDSATRRPRTEPLEVQRIVRYALDRVRVDTVLTAPRGYVDAASGPDASGTFVTRLGLGPYAPLNAWTVLPDGRLLHADAATYALALHAPDGDTVRTWRFPQEPIPLSDSAWEASLERARAASRGLLNAQAQSMSGTLGRAVPPPSDAATEVPPRPSHVPALAFASGAHTLHVAGATVWVPVHLDDRGEQPGWDVLDLDRGERVRRFTLPARHRILLVTTRAVYLVHVDDNDLERVLRLELALP